MSRYQTDSHIGLCSAGELDGPSFNNVDEASPRGSHTDREITNIQIYFLKLRDYGKHWRRPCLSLQQDKQHPEDVLGICTRCLLLIM